MTLRLRAVLDIPAAERWEAGRAIRNMFTHDYPETPEAKAAAVNVAFDMADELERTYSNIEARIGK